MVDLALCKSAVVAAGQDKEEAVGYLSRAVELAKQQHETRTRDLPPLAALPAEFAVEGDLPEALQASEVCQLATAWLDR
jgi:hypothetical protein